MEEIFSDPGLAQFYDLDTSSNNWDSEIRLLGQLAQNAKTVLDLCCGTGAVTMQLPAHCHITGVDAARAMLDLARGRTNADKIQWVEADLRDVRLGSKFDLIIMTGNAFQCLLTDEDQRAAFLTIAAHLNPQGRFIFDTRNPERREWQEWTPDLSRRDFLHPVLGSIQAWNDVSFDHAAGVATYETIYRASARTWRASAQIRFTGRDQISDRLREAGLRVQQWLGSWEGEVFDEGSAEIIPLGTLMS